MPEIEFSIPFCTLVAKLQFVAKPEIYIFQRFTMPIEPVDVGRSLDDHIRAAEEFFREAINKTVPGRFVLVECMAIKSNSRSPDVTTFQRSP